MTDELETIRERHDEWERIGFIKAGPAAAIDAHTDRATLLRALDAMAEENARMKEALQTIHDRYIPDQPAAYDVSEADYTRKHYMELRMIARAALKEPGQ